MMYVDFSAGNKDYKLRLNIRNTLALEKKLGCNPLSIFGNGTTIPTVTMMVDILHASLQEFQHNINAAEAMNIFEDYLNDGHTAIDFVEVILEIYKVSGLLKTDTINTEKN